MLNATGEVCGILIFAYFGMIYLIRHCLLKYVRVIFYDSQLLVLVLWVELG
jgi:hypothetical protein